MKHFNFRSYAFGLTMLAVAGVFAQVPSPAGRAFDDAAKRALAATPGLKSSPCTLIVRYRPGVSVRTQAAARSWAGATFVRTLSPLLGIELVGTWRPSETATLLSVDPNVMYVEPDYVVHADVIPNDTSFGILWGMHNTGQSGGVVDADIDAPEAWDVTTGDPNFVIADIDTGLDYNHTDIAANAWSNPGEIPGNGLDDDSNGFVDDIHGWDFYNNDGDPFDDNAHGTHTAGTIGAVGNNGTGVTGVNWRCKLMALKFLSAGGSGFTSGAIGAVDYARAMSVRISNNSWGGGGFSQALFDSINNAKSVGHLFIAAAGNNGANNDASPFYPASYNLDNIIAVASMDRFDNRSSFSNYGATSVDLGAPGSSILSTVPGNAYSTFNGTSMATPHVSGVVALVTVMNPGWTYSQIRTRVFSTVRPTSAMAGITVTGGVVNAAAAVAGSTNTAPTVTISSPSNGASFQQGATVTFVGTANDAQQGNMTSALVWTSSLQGQIGTGGSFSRSDLVVGTHTVTASVTDSGGLTGSASVSISVTVNTGLPAAPTNLNASRLADNVARCTWTDNSGNETNFDIEREVRNGNSWGGTTQFSVGANVTTFDNSAGNGRFRYRVRARNANGSSAWTNWVVVRL